MKSENLDLTPGVCLLFAGYYCPSGADVSNYLLCTEGSYCPEGSDVPVPCPSGTFSNMTGLGNVSECSDCTGGYYCPDPGQDTCWSARLNSSFE